MLLARQFPGSLNGCFVRVAWREINLRAAGRDVPKGRIMFFILINTRLCRKVLSTIFLRAFMSQLIAQNIADYFVTVIEVTMLDQGIKLTSKSDYGVLNLIYPFFVPLLRKGNAGSTVFCNKRPASDEMVNATPTVCVSTICLSYITITR